MQYGEGKLRHAGIFGIEQGLHPVGRQGQGRFLGKEGGIVTGIVGDGHAPIRLADAVDIGGQALRCPAHGEHVELARAGAQHAAHAGGTEFDPAGKGVADGFLVVFHGFELGFPFSARQLFLPQSKSRAMVHIISLLYVWLFSMVRLVIPCR